MALLMLTPLPCLTPYSYCPLDYSVAQLHFKLTMVLEYKDDIQGCLFIPTMPLLMPKPSTLPHPLCVTPYSYCPLNYSEAELHFKLTMVLQDMDNIQGYT